MLNATPSPHLQTKATKFDIKEKFLEFSPQTL